MNADGSEQTVLAGFPTGVSWYHPTWSPDGSRIAFASDLDKDAVNYWNYEIYVMNADGSDLRRITNHPAVDYTPAWSPDGTRIVFQSNRDWDANYGPSNIYVMNVDGSGVTRLTHDAVHDEGPVWSPDGTRIAFSSERTPSHPYSNRQIYAANADGSGLVRLTQVVSPGYAGSPAWSPVGAVPAAPPLSIQEIGGDAQTDTVGATLAEPLRVRVVQGGLPVQGVPVQWLVQDRLGSISPAAATTNADGVAAALWSLGPEAGGRTASAFVAVGSRSLVASFTATAVPGQPAFTSSGVDVPPVVEVGSTLDISAVVFDGHGNPLSGVQVDFAVTLGAGTVDPVRATTAERARYSPRAWASFALGAEEAVNEATATVPAVPGHPPIVFTTRTVTAVVVNGSFENPVFNVFTPADVSVPAGRTVGWMLGYAGLYSQHDITFEDDPTQPTSSGDLSGSGVHVRTFEGPPRTIRYRCTFHSTSFTEGMVGTVTIQ
jgi:plastocyanin